ncbi:YkgJ family cysteine cluster protein [Reinekea marina]|uniref:YkgJ family cysteine cluster protein n=1 Tax=Reinekea marina TaxID=1310421 RepID=A0ABV7WV42_9GAMM|nr:YkgJ family cysteine cluster protein [Reinekea marina]MDN3650138.1 YkgJ family cysteine cluster protein [Reinekea marina]
MECRLGCGACCIAPSINEPFYGMPSGKPAGVVCVHLDQKFNCKIFDRPERPTVCANFKAEAAICGVNREQALSILNNLEVITTINVT